MEELKRRLEFPNAAIQIQAVGKLVEQALSKQQIPLGTATTESVELGLLWQTCGHSDAVLCSSACEAVFTLVQESKAEHDYVLKALLNLVPSAKNVSGIVQTITDLLVHQLLCVTQEGQPYTNPYGIRNPPHPLVTIATSRPDSWPLLQQQLHRLLGWQVKRVQDNVVGLLAPFLQFVLLEPHLSPQFTQVRLTTVSSLLQRAGPGCHLSVVNFLLDTTSCIQLQTAVQYGEAATFLQTLLWHVGQRSVSVPASAHFLSRLCCQCLVLCSAGLTTHAHMISALLEVLLETVQQHPQSLACSDTITHLVALLRSVPPKQLTTVLHLAMLCLNNCHVWTPLQAGMLVFPCLHIIATPNPVTVDSNKSTNQMIALKLLKVLEMYIAEQRETDPDTDDIQQDITLRIAPHGYTYQTYSVLTDLLRKQSAAITDWLVGIQSAINQADHVPYHVTCLVASLLVLQKEAGVVRLCLKTLAAIAEKEVGQAPSMLPLLLYKMGREPLPEMKQSILDAIPSVATHKVTIAPTLRCLQMLGSTTALRAVAMRLVTSLWQQQDRCFPQLQQMLLETGRGTVSMATQLDDVLVAKAACMRDVCKLRPDQHGADLLSPLSSILNECTSETDAVAASLALEGLGYLCQAEVIDIGTAWSVLAAKLGKDTRPLVVSRICQLLSLVPGLRISSKQYEEFSSDVVKRLWLYTENADPMVSGAAYRALANFPPTAFNIFHLPAQVTAEARKAAAAAAAADEKGEEKMAAPEVPGVSYTHLLKLLPDTVHKDYQTMLTSLLRQEVSSLPRSIYHSSYRRQTSTAAQDKAISAIPEFVQAEYGSNKQPGLRAALAVAQLMTYDPQMTLGRDGKPRRTQVIQHGRSYQQMLYTLLQEVSVQPSDWRLCMVVPYAWVAFLDRCFLAYVEMRRMELVLEMEKGQTTDAEENQLHQDTAWLWARDKLADLIKSSSRGSPTVQGNSMHALASLAVASTRYASSLESEALAQCEAVPEHLGPAHWLSIVTNTLLSTLDVSHKPQSRVFSMCQQRVSGPKTAASILARACAATALAQLSPILITGHTDAIYSSLQILSGGLPDIQPDISAVLHLHNGLALGMMLAQLFREHFADVAGTQGMVAVWKAVDQLEKTCLTTAQDREGSILGLAVCLSSMSADGKMDTRVHVRSVHEQLAMAVDMTDPSDCLHEPFCICLAYMSTSAYSANILSQDAVDRLVGQLYQLHCQETQSVGVSLALGCMCHGLWKASHPTVGDLIPKLFATWISSLQDTNTPTLQVLSYLAGVMAMAGSEAGLLSVESETASSTQPVSVTDLLKVASGLVRSSSSLAVQGQAAWLQAHLYMATASTAHTTATVPLSYQYLPETSMLRALVDLVIEAGKLGPEGVKSQWLHVALKSLIDGATAQRLPPVNWAGVLSPIMRMEYGEAVQTLCVELPACQSTASPSAAMFLASWMVTPLYNSLNAESKASLQTHLPTLIKCVAPSKLTEYFEQGFLQAFIIPTGGAPKWQDCCHALRGLQRALQVHDPPQSVTLLLYQLLDTVYGHLPTQTSLTVQACATWRAMCQCLMEVPDEVVDRVTAQDLEQPERHVQALYVRCYLVSSGSQPLAWLNRAVEAVMFSSHCAQEVALQLLLQCFEGCTHSKAESCRVLHRQHWLLELMGHIKNMAAGVIHIEGADVPTGQVIEFLILVFSAAVASWSNMDTSLVLGLPSFEGEVDAEDVSMATECTSVSSQLPVLLKLLLPESLNMLFSVEPWKQMTSKMIDWLLSMLATSTVQENEEHSVLLKGCLFSLRETADFKKMTIWSRAYRLL